MSPVRWRLTLALTNLALALLLVASAAWVLVLARRPGSPLEHRVPAPVTVPRGSPASAETVELLSRALDVPPPPAAPTAREDARATADPAREFASRYRVVLATFDPDPAARRCIVAPRSSTDQVALAPGERLGDYVLLAIEPLARDPRSVRLRFSDLVRGVQVAVTLSPEDSAPIR